MKYLRPILATLLVAAILGLGMFLTQHASAAVRASHPEQLITASVVGTSPPGEPTNGVLTIYDNVTALHHTRSVVYYDADGYSKTANLVTSATPIGVVLKSEDIENNCASGTARLGTVNPVGGTGIECHPVLHSVKPVPYPVTGDLTGRYCRVPPPGHTGSCPFAVHRTETATGKGPYLTVGDIDHGALRKVSYYTWVGTQEVEVTVKLPIPVLVTHIDLVPTSNPAPSAVLTLGGPTPIVQATQATSTAPASTSTAPENVKVTVVCFNSSGAKVTRHWDMIGSGPSSGGSQGDSPLRDSMNGKTLIIDGGCSLSNAVLIGP